MLVISAFLFASCGSDTESTTKDPNVVLIFIDDEGYGDPGCYGAGGYTTPAIDHLASQGMRFTHYYSAQSVCSVSRAALMTGCYPNRLGIPGAFFPDDVTGLNQDEFTMAEMFKEQGYVTACIGKWHLGWQEEFLPMQHGFDEYFGLPYSNDMWPNDNVTGQRLPPGKSSYPALPLIEGNSIVDSIVSMKDQDKLTTLYTEKAVDFIHRNAEHPFFLYVPHTMGHIPLGVSDKFRGKSEHGLYGDVMMEIDWSVAEIEKALKENNLTDNTIFIFTTDNGPWLNYGNHAGSAGGLREGKMTNWEGGQRVPFIIRWPGNIPGGTVCNELACSIDLLPTLASILDAELSDNKIDGVNISTLWKGDFSSSPRETILYYHSDGLNAVRKGKWKLVLPHTYRSYNAEPGKDGHRGGRVRTTVEEPELYNLFRDPGESYNIIDYNPDVVSDIMIVVEEARKELGDVNVGLEKGSGSREIGRLKN